MLRTADNETNQVKWSYRWKRFWVEFLLSSALIAMVVLFSMWPVFSAPNHVYPATVDGMGHLTKVKYIADCFKELKWPSWFPHWYSGSTVMQYYPPLSYLLLAPVQIIFDNVMVTYKYFLFMTQFVGSLGVWFICRRFIGSWSGLVGGILYALQPFLLRSLVFSGVIAQGPIFALTPWLLFFTLLFLQRRTPLRWALVSASVGLLILSHPMHAFLVSICVGVLAVSCLIRRSVDFTGFIIWASAVTVGAGLVSFWWMIGATQLENAGIPYVLPEGRIQYIANLSWYNPAYRSGSGYYFSLSMLIVAIISMLYRKTAFGQYKIPFFLSLVFSIIMSFGSNFPLLRYIPMNESLFPGRILSFGSSATVSPSLQGFFLL